MSLLVSRTRSSDALWLTVDADTVTLSKRPPVVRALGAVEFGLGFGYPTCCVQEFALDILNGRLPARRRGTVPNGEGGFYVPCTSCCEALGREVIR